ncbi:MAG: HAMP domain-containing protein, partial [Methanobacteriota archaeon]
MILITLIQVYLTFHSCKSFMNEMEQRLNFPLAHKLALSLQPHLNPPHKAEIAKIVQEFLKHSPGIDIYLLDQNYRVVASLTREEHQFVTTQISAAPIEKSLQPNPMLPIVAEDPLSTRKCIFSISPIHFNGHESGFLYIILNEHSNTSSLQMLSESYIVQSAIKTLGLTFLLSIGVGLFSFALITRRLKKITRAVQDFENGNLPEPIKISTQDEVGQLARAFNQMAGTIVDHLKEIQRQEKLKNELVANISHDIRSPLTILQGYVETMMLKESLLTPEVRRKYLEKIFNNTQELNKLVDELFELSRLENQDIHPQPEAFSLQELIHDILLDYLPIAERRKIQLDLQSPPTLPFVVGDLKMIQRAITHLLDNALAFTPQGGKVTIALNM